MMASVDCILKVRCVKPYQGAHNHIAVGMVLRETAHYLELHCRTIHYGQWQMNLHGVHQGAVAVRLIPWHRIEVMHRLPEDTDWKADIALDRKGNLVLNNRHKTLIADATAKCQNR
ncbi:MAG TPA: hypothetical protein PK082_04075 [Phycisphaerae bacterium]|nr:hypothetical protein [Phycisphaerae bacterium]